MKEREKIEKEKIDIKSVVDELSIYEKRGVTFTVNGRERNKRDVVKAVYVRERSDFMMDYEFDENGKVSKIHYNEVKEEKKSRNNHNKR